MTFQPIETEAGKAKFVSTADGNRRPLGIPTIRDRVAQMAVKLVIEPIFEADFENCSFGFRPKRDAHQAIEAVRQALYRAANKRVLPTNASVILNCTSDSSLETFSVLLLL